MIFKIRLGPRRTRALGGSRLVGSAQERRARVKMHNFLAYFVTRDNIRAREATRARAAGHTPLFQCDVSKGISQSCATQLTPYCAPIKWADEKNVPFLQVELFASPAGPGRRRRGSNTRIPVKAQGTVLSLDSTSSMGSGTGTGSGSDSESLPGGAFEI